MLADRLPRRGGRSGTPGSEVGPRHLDAAAQPAWPLSYADRAVPGDDTVNLRALVGILRRRWLLIIGATAVLTALSALAVLNMSPRYSAVASLMLDTRKTQVVNIEAVMSGLTTDTAVMRSEVDVLSSPMLAGRVVDKLQLESNSRFNRALGATLNRASWQADASRWLYTEAAKWVPSTWIDRLTFGTMIPEAMENGSSDKGLTPTQKRQQLVDALLARLRVANDGKSYGIKLTFEWEDPEIATSVVNTLAQLYIDDQLESKGEATRRANSWLNARLQELRDVVRKADMAVQDYRAQHHIFPGSQKGTTVAEQQLSELQTQFVIASADAVQKAAALKSRGRDAVGAGQDSAVLSSPLIQQLRAQEAEVLRKQAAARTLYGENYPDAIAWATQLQKLRQTVQDESAKLSRDSQNGVSSAQTRVAQLREAIAAAEDRVAHEDASSVRLKELAREAEANENLYKSFLSRYLETSKQEDLQLPDARIISLATVPVRPTFPNTKLFIAVAIVFSTAVGIGLAFFSEHFDPTFRRLDQLATTGFPGIGMLPQVRAAKRQPAWVANEIAHSPASPYSEAVRSIRYAMRMSSHDPLKTILVTSAVPGEGKTLFAVSLAGSLVRAGRRVLLVDCDLRKPTVGKVLNAASRVDLRGIACGEKDLESTIQIDEATGLHYIASVGADPNSGSYIDFIDSNMFGSFLDRVKGRYDLVLLDSPPVQVVSDALLLARYVDSTLFLVRWGKTPRSVAVTAMERVAATGVDVAGVVLSQVNLKKHARYLRLTASGWFGQYHDYSGADGANQQARRLRDDNVSSRV